ncbi:MAG: GTPase Era [Bacilli bacterium]|nr:GTPase Era [Bacilli bacterium]
MSLSIFARGFKMKSGFVSLIGRPNVGKSTLLNAIIGRKVAITSSTAQTTRNMIQGIYHGDDLQIVFVDTPGIHKPQNKLGKALNKQAYYNLDDVDVILFLTDVTQKLGTGDKFIIEKLKETKVPVILILNKIDKIPYEMILPKIVEYKDLYDFKEIIPVSAFKKKNIDELIKTVSKYLTDDIKYFDDNTITNVSTTFSISELIREKVLFLTKEEVPHSVTCIVEDISEDKNNVSIGASVIVDRENLKKILVGKNGSMIKKIGMEARKDIEELLNKKVYLDLRVKVVNNWREKDQFLNQLGYEDFNS